MASLPVAAVAQGPAPIVTVASSSVFIGDSTTLVLTFENTGDEAGFGPYIALCLPYLGEDGDDLGEPCDGLSFVTAKAIFDNGNIALPPAGGGGVQVVLPTGSTVSCPGTVTSAEHPLCASNFELPAGSLGCQLVILELPFGSFYPDQPPITVEVTVDVQAFADEGEPLTVFATGGFQFGDDPLGGDPCLVGSTASTDVVPMIFQLDKMTLAPENETATGPNFPRRFGVTVDIANGQTVSPLVVTDDLPEGVVYTGPYTAPVISAPQPGQQNGQLVLDFGSITGTASDVDAAFEFGFYVPKETTDGLPILEPGRCVETLENPLAGSGDWTPADPRDPTPQQHPSPVRVEGEASSTIDAKCLALQKSPPAVAIDAGHPGPTPGDVLEYTLDFQLSDYFQAGGIVLRDLLPDGLSPDASFPPILRVEDKHGVTQTQLVPGPTGFDVDANARDVCGDGTLGLTFYLSAAMVAENAGAGNAPPLHDQGILTGALSTPQLPQVPGARGTLSYRAVIEDQFVCHSGDLSVDKHDRFLNLAVIDAELLDPDDNQPLGESAGDDSRAAIGIPAEAVRKTVYARNGDPDDPALAGAKPTFAPGDTVTFRVTYTIPSSDAEAVRIEDFLPSPVFKATELSTSQLVPCIGTDPPPQGSACYLPTDTLAPFLGAPPRPESCGCPNVAGYVCPDSNSLCFDYGDFDDPQNQPRTIDFLFTLTLTDDPFVDGLDLTNELVEVEENSFGETHQQVVIQQIELGQPVLEIEKGAVAACCPNPDLESCEPAGIFDPPPAAVHPFAPPGTACPEKFTPPVTSSALADLAGGFEAGDLVTFAIVVENVGSSPHGAFDVVVRDTLPPGFSQPAGGAQPCVFDGAGTPRPYQTLPGGLFGAGIELVDPGPNQGALAPGKPVNNAGTNVAVITVDLVVDSDLEVGQCVLNRTAVAAFAGTEGGPSHVTPETAASYAGSSEVCMRPQLAKSLVSTSEAHTSGNRVAIGEVARFRLEMQMPRGTLPALEIVDLLPPGLRFFDDGEAKIALVSSNGGLTSSVLSGLGLAVPGDETTVSSIVPTFAYPSDHINAGPAFDLGDLINLEKDCDQEFVVIEFNVQVANVPGNQQDTLLTNRAKVTTSDTQIAVSPPVTLRVDEPRLELSKRQLTPERYRLELINDGLTDAFDAELFDLIPFARCLDTGSIVINSAGGVTGIVQSSTANTVRVRVARMPPGSSVIIHFLAPPCRPKTCFNSANRADVVYTSLPGPRGSLTNPTGSPTRSTSGATDGERNGSGGVNDHFDGVELTDPGLDCAPDLSLGKQLAAPLVSGQPAKYLITVTNATGPEVIATSGPIVVSEPLPPGLTFMPTPGAYGPGWQCSASGTVSQTVTCTHPGPLQPGTSLTLGLTVAVAADAQVPIENCASVATSGDPGDDDDQACASGGGCEAPRFTYTTVADFRDGIAGSVQKPYHPNVLTPDSNASSSTVLPSGQLELKPPPLDPFPFVNVAASDLDTMVRIDAKTGDVIGEYWTRPENRLAGGDPSRTTVDLLGNAWVSNRGEAEGDRGSVVRIGIVLGGQRVNANGDADLQGQFLKGPFEYNTCEDRYGGTTLGSPKDGLIRTSFALGNVLDWKNTNDVDDDGGVSTAEDECIINYVRTAATKARTIAVDQNNDVWVGGINMAHEKLSGLTGQPITGTAFNKQCGGYGGLIDPFGVLWSARFPDAECLLRHDPGGGSTPLTEEDYFGNYGLALDPNTCRVWFSKLAGRSTPEVPLGGEVCALKPNGDLVDCYSHGNPDDERAQGLAVDAAGNVWVAHSIPSATTVGRLRTDGTLMDPVPLQRWNATSQAFEGPLAMGPTGVAVDVNGKVWVTNRDSDNVMRIDRNAIPQQPGFNSGTVDLVVPLRPGSRPYNYSDMTGFISRNNPPNSFWTVTQDGGVAGTRWCKVCWNQESTGKGADGIKVEVRASDTLNTGQWTEIANCQPLLGLEGRYLDVRVTLVRELDPAITCGLSPETPILTDITLEACCSCPEGTEEGQIGLDYPDRDCAAAIASAQNPAALNMPLYRIACEEVLGAEVLNGVLSAQVTNCEESPGGGAFVEVELCCAPPPPFCPPGQETATIGALGYPAPTTCQEATQAAESPSSLSSFHYRNACRDATGGALADAVLAAAVTSCEPASGGGVNLGVEVCCPEPLPMADLTVAKLRPAGGFLVVGNEAEYELIVTNLGPVPTADFGITDTLPSNLSFVQILGSDWSCSVTPVPPQTVQCSYLGPPLAAGASTSLGIKVKVRSRPFALEVRNCASVLPLDDPDPTNNKGCDSASVTWPVCEPDPNVGIELISPFFRAGQTDRLRLTLATGACFFPGPVFISAQYGPDFEFVSGEGMGDDPSDAGWACRQRVSQELECEHPGPLPVETNTAVEIAFDVAGDAEGETSVCGEAAVPWRDGEITATDCLAVSVEPAGEPPDLAVSKTIAEKPRQGQAAFRLEVENRGAGPTRGPILVTDTLPAGLRFVEAAGEDWSCQPPGVCRYVGRAIEPGAATPPLLVRVERALDAEGVQVNCVGVTARGDANPANDESCVELPPERPETSFKLRLFATYANASGRFEEGEGEGVRSFGLGDGFGPGFSLEYQPRPRFGIELGHFRSSLGVRAAEFGLVSDSDRRLELTTLGVNFHFAPWRPFDVYAGLFAGELRLSDPSTVDTDIDSALGLLLGLDLPLSASRWCLALQARYFDTTAEVIFAESGERIDASFDFLIASFGVGYRF